MSGTPPPRVSFGTFMALMGGVKRTDRAMVCTCDCVCVCAVGYKILDYTSSSNFTPPI